MVYVTQGEVGWSAEIGYSKNSPWTHTVQLLIVPGYSHS